MSLHTSGPTRTYNRSTRTSRVDSPPVSSLADLTALELRERFAARDVSPVEALDATARRIAEREPELNAFITLTLETAREQALAAETAYRDGTAGALAGIPTAIKDLFDTAGVRTTYGSVIFGDHVPDRDADAVRLLKQAGAVIVGKTLTHEFAWGITSANPHFGPCRNPYDTARVPGGSSGGSAAALAAGMCALALGSDTGGSIRIPAAFCGVSGLKPTYGRISTKGVFPLAPSLDHAGPMARTPGDVRLLYDALTQQRADQRPASRIALCPDLHLRAPDPGIQRAFDAAVAALDADLVELSFPDAERIHPAFQRIQAAEARHTHRTLFPAHADRYGDDVKSRLHQAQDVSLDDYVGATATRATVHSAFATLFEHADLLITPIHATPPAPIAHQPGDFRERVLTYTVPQDMAGLPAAAIPAGRDDDGLPVGVQLTGPAGSEHRVLAAAAELYARLGGEDA
jgi:aspartyl-tRNA(Asn)/glutamyl-tRNA(Gln) amidotransferase subunit A